MTQTDKFRSEITRIVARAESEHYNARKTCELIAAQFENSFRALGELPSSLADYWTTQALKDSPEAPNDAYIDKLCAIFSLLADGELSPEDDACFSSSDWKEIANLINYEADKLPLDTLSTLMALLVEKKAL
ncbi:MAG: hypothetical protein J6I73_02000 [Treponema sp.]|nr:hypothetical protein [Treponema sp.]